MKTVYFTAVASLVSACCLAGAVNAQQYNQAQYWDGYRNDTSSPQFAMTAQPSPNPYGYQAAQPISYPLYGTPATPVNNDMMGPSRPGMPYGFPESPSYGTMPTSNTVGGGPVPMGPSIMQPGPVGAEMATEGISSYMMDGCSTGGCGINTACAPRPAQWYFGLDAIFLTRVAGNSYALLKTPDVSGQNEPTVLDVADFSYDFKPGLRLNGGRMVCGGWGFEVGYMQLTDGWDYATTQTGVLELQGWNWTIGSDPAAGLPVSFRINNHSELYSLHANLTRGLCDWATLKFGLRYIDFQDILEVDELYTPMYNLVIADTYNRMIGPQCGAEVKLLEAFCCRLRLNAWANCGFLYNDVHEDPYSSVVGPALASSGNSIALLGEFGLSAKYRISEHCAARIGYEFMGIHGVALAPDQMATADIVAETAYINPGSLIAHGGSFGIEVFY